ncbi:hypothetical protein PR202_ga24824 [Eleusine coracana subsp. coracana]|uniref:RING-type domain-containing protein n=1 Tax=Eleusine coracana subsp. coracana TaxID=191504 RepID=A0AAV5D9Z2_ELECO|nr:hypothetical protein PR202_ga24824 [Eleusine coracana subsp. coracana]
MAKSVKAILLAMTLVAILYATLQLPVQDVTPRTHSLQMWELPLPFDHDLAPLTCEANGGFGGVPASADAIAGLPLTTVAAGEAAVNDRCAVCHEGYEAGDRVRTMPCAHGFHEGCIVGWLSVSRLCPLCRFKLTTETEQAARLRRR